MTAKRKGKAKKLTVKSVSPEFLDRVELQFNNRIYIYKAMNGVLPEPFDPNMLGLVLIKEIRACWEYLAATERPASKRRGKK